MVPSATHMLGQHSATELWPQSFLSFETGPHDPPASASLVAGITGLGHQAQLVVIS